MLRQEVQSTRVWLTTASESMLVGMAGCAVGWASQELVETYGFPMNVVEKPTADQLVTMFEVLSPELAHCTLYGLLHASAERLPAAAIAVENRARLVTAADREPPPDAGRIGSSLVEKSDEVTPQRAAGDGEKKAERHMTTGGGHTDGIEHVESVDDARSVGAGLREAGSELAQALQDTASAVSEGRAPSAWEHLAESLSEWARSRADLATVVTRLEGDWPAGAGYTELEEELDRLDHVRAERAQNLEQLEKLRRRASQYEQLIADAESDAEAGALRTALDEIRGKISHVSAALGEARQAADGMAGDRPAEEAERTGENAAVRDEVSEAASPDDGEPAAGEAQTATTEEEAPVPFPSAEPATETAADVSAERQPESALMPEEAEQLSEPRAGSVLRDDQGDSSSEEEPPPTPTALSPGTPEALVEQLPDDAPSGEPQRAAGDRVLPWSAGGRVSHVAGLVSQGRLPHAYWMTVASDEPGHRAEALSFASAAFACAGVDSATQVQMTHDVAPADLIEDREAHLTATVAAIRSGLTAGWPHVLVSDFSMPSGLSIPWQQLLTVLVTAVRECHTYEPGSVEDVPEAEQRLTVKDMEENARLLLEDLPRRKIKYQRASRVLQYLVGPSGELRQALQTVLAWARGTDDGSTLRTLSENLRRSEYIDRLVEDADSRFRTPKQAKEAIHSGALRQLRTAISSVSELVTKAEAMAAAARAQDTVSGPKVPQLDEALKEVQSYEVPAGVGGAALGLLRKWLIGELPMDADETADAEGSARPSDDCLLLVPDLPRGTDGNPDFSDARMAPAMAALLAPASPDEVLTAYLDLGDLHLARALVRFVEKSRSDDGAASSEWLEEAGRRCREAEKEWRRRTGERHREAATHLAQIRTLNLMPPDKEREYTGRLQQFADGDEAGRYRYALDTLGEFVSELTKLVADSTKRLRDRLDTLKPDPERPLSDHDHDRILRLIDEGDTVTAQEFLALVEGGERLPDRPEHEGAELREFIAELSGPGAPVPGGDGVPAGWWADRYGSGTKLTSNGEKGISSWKSLCTKRGRNSEWSRHIPEVLRCC